MLLKALGEQTTEDMRRRYVRVLLCGNFSVSCIEYDVSSAPVSLHLPLSRLIAGLSLKLEKFGLSFTSDDFNVPGKPSPEELMEPVLRTQVMIAQVRFFKGLNFMHNFNILKGKFFFILVSVLFVELNFIDYY